MSSTEVFVAAGSNVRPAEHLPRALELIRAQFGSARLSPVYSNAAVGFDGDDFYNLVLVFDTRATPHEARAWLRRIEWACGRRREARRYADRSLDLDMLLYGDLVADQPRLQLPRPDLLCQPFVLRPMADLAPERRHPVTGRSYAEHWADLDHEAHPMHAVVVPGLP